MNNEEDDSEVHLSIPVNGGQVLQGRENKINTKHERGRKRNCTLKTEGKKIRGNSRSSDEMIQNK